MIVELTKENLYEIDNSFMEPKTVQHEFDINPFARYLIYKENETVIGYIYYSDIYERVEINQIEIEIFNRNCGKGSKLLKKLIDIVDKDITLEVKKDNIPAIKLYEKFDFKRKAIRRGYYNGIDGILMERINNNNAINKGSFN